MHGHAKSPSSSTLSSQPDLVLYLNEEDPEYTYGGSSPETCVSAVYEFIPEEDVCFPNVQQQDDTSFDSKALDEYLATGRHQIHRRKTSSRRKSIVMQEQPYNINSQITYFSPEMGSIKASSLSGLASPKHSLSDLLSLNMYWIDFLNPSHNDLKWVGKIFHIHPLTIEDIQGAENREKCESFRNYYFVSIQTFNPDEDSGNHSSYVDNSLSIYNIVMRNCVLSFHYLPIHHPEKVLTRYEQLKEYLVLTPDWINYALMDSIVDDFIPLEENLELEADSIDELVFILKESEQADMLRRIGNARKALSGLLRILKPKADVVKAVIKRIDALKTDERHEIGLYLGDIQDHILTMVQSAAHFEKILSRAHSNYLAQISIEITQTSNEMNDVVAKLTVIASVLVPMNIITGLWGMNVRVPGQDELNLYWFFGIVGFMVVMFTLSVLYCVRKKII